MLYGPSDGLPGGGGGAQGLQGGGGCRNPAKSTAVILQPPGELHNPNQITTHRPGGGGVLCRHARVHDYGRALPEHPTRGERGMVRRGLRGGVRGGG